ncbi:MAG: TrbG/VirB9 family P-type conjugative transfer protein [Rickettsiales bacterium]
MLKFRKFIYFILAGFFLLQANADIPIATDNRIKTYVYNPNDIYLVLMESGFQTSIEFARGEKVQTMSLGNSYSWSITPVNNRIFIKPLEDTVRTNMTVITNKRTYQFDLVSKNPEQDDLDVAYVVRFFYPKTSM